MDDYVKQSLIDEYMPVIISRKEWKAKKAKRKHKQKHPINTVVFLNTKTNPCYDKDHCSYEVRKIQKQHMEDGKSDIQYNFIIGRDGNIYEGRGWFLTQTKYRPDPDNLNEKSIEIAFIGHNFMHPNQRQLHSAMSIMMEGTQKNYLVYDVMIMQSEIDEPLFAGGPDDEDNGGKGIIVPYYEDEMNDEDIDDDKLETNKGVEENKESSDEEDKSYKDKYMVNLRI